MKKFMYALLVSVVSTMFAFSGSLAAWDRYNSTPIAYNGPATFSNSPCFDYKASVGVTRGTVSWDAVPGANRYEVRLRNIEKGTVVPMGSVQTPQITMTFPQLGHHIVEVKSVKNLDNTTVKALRSGSRNDLVTFVDTAQIDVLVFNEMTDADLLNSIIHEGSSSQWAISSAISQSDVNNVSRCWWVYAKPSGGNRDLLLTLGGNSDKEMSSRQETDRGYPSSSSEWQRGMEEQRKVENKSNKSRVDKVKPNKSAKTQERLNRQISKTEGQIQKLENELATLESERANAVPEDQAVIDVEIAELSMDIQNQKDKLARLQERLSNTGGAEMVPPSNGGSVEPTSFLTKVAYGDDYMSSDRSRKDDTIGRLKKEKRTKVGKSEKAQKRINKQIDKTEDHIKDIEDELKDLQEDRAESAVEEQGAIDLLIAELERDLQNQRDKLARLQGSLSGGVVDDTLTPMTRSYDRNDPYDRHHMDRMDRSGLLDRTSLVLADYTKNDRFLFGKKEDLKQEDLSILDRRISNLESRIETMQYEINYLRESGSDVDDLEVRIEDMQTEVNRLREIRSKLYGLEDSEGVVTYGAETNSRIDRAPYGASPRYGSGL